MQSFQQQQQKQHESSTRASSSAAAAASTSPSIGTVAISSTTLPIWATRPIDWPPLNTKIPMAMYVKLYKVGRNAAALSIQSNNKNRTVNTNTTASSTVPSTPSTLPTSTVSSTNNIDIDHDAAGGNTNNYFTGLMNRVLNPTTTSSSTATTSGTGRMTSGDDDDDDYHSRMNAYDTLLMEHSTTKDASTTNSNAVNMNTKLLPLRSPRPGCVAAANGWIVAVVECPMVGMIMPPPTSSTSQPSSSSSSFTPPPLRLLNRWNVRRGGGGGSSGMGGGGGNSSIANSSNTMSGGGGGGGMGGSNSNSNNNSMEQWTVIPPPVLVRQQQNQYTPTMSQPYDRNHYYGRIVHVFVDPTGSHTIMSASNGETYYAHYSSNVNPNLLSSHHHHHHHQQQNNNNSHTTQNQNLPKVATKLNGFGIDPTNVPHSCKITGISASSTAFRSKSMNTNDTANNSSSSTNNIQIGMTPNTYITAVAWDKERGTEGSTKIILLGTSNGEIYEYGLTSSMATGSSNSYSSSGNNNNNTTNFVYDDTASTIPSQPVLLHKLVRTDDSANITTHDVSEIGAAVTGIYFERLRTGLMVMVSTSGRQKRTRLYTFYSPHSSSFRMVLADQQHTNLQELPGSIDFADLKYCNDHFALRTQTGIYYGTIDRSLSGPSIMSGSRSSMIIDSGILPYAIHKNGTSSIPISLALTPHHIVTLTEQNDIHFINRVAQTLIQKERIDMTLTTSVTALEESATFLGNNFGEFLMDIRRPDQIWLRKGRSLIHISSSQEDRDVWKFTLQKCLNMSIPSSTATSTTMAADPKNYTALLTSRASPPQRFGLSDEEKAQEALFEQAKTLCTNASQKVRFVLL